MEVEKVERLSRSKFETIFFLDEKYSPGEQMKGVVIRRHENETLTKKIKIIFCENKN
jgi:hypothetical protein